MSKLSDYISRKQLAGEVLSLRQVAQYLKGSNSDAFNTLERDEKAGDLAYTVLEVGTKKYIYLTSAAGVEQYKLLLPPLSAEAAATEWPPVVYATALEYTDAFRGPEAFSWLQTVFQDYDDSFRASWLYAEAGFGDLPERWSAQIAELNSYANFSAAALDTVPTETEETPLAEDELPSATQLMEEKVTSQPSFADLAEAPMDLVMAVNPIEAVHTNGTGGHCALCGKPLSTEGSVARGMGPTCVKRLAAYIGVPEENITSEEITADAVLEEWVKDFKANDRRPKFGKMEEALAVHPEGLIAFNELVERAKAAQIPVNWLLKAVGGNKGLGPVKGPEWEFVLVGGKKRYLSVKADLRTLSK